MVSEYNILLIGETGSGKSTLINYLTNYFHGGSLKELRIAIPTKYHKATEKYQSSEKDLYDATKSKTSECTTYDFTKANRLYNFIDTPGLSDTEGTEKDDQHISKIMIAAEETESMAAIILVINGTVARATVNLRNTLTRLRGSVPDILLNNLIVVLTNCSVSSANFDLESLEGWTVSEENVFYMNNSGLSRPKEYWMSSMIMTATFISNWRESIKEINSILLRMEKLGSVATNAFREMREKRNKIKEEITGILLEVKKLQDTQSKLKSAKEAHKEVTENVEKYSNYKQNEEVDCIEMEKTENYVWICKNSSQVCVPFSLDIFYSYINDPGKQPKFSKCPKCGCMMLHHRIDKEKKPVKKTKTVEKILHEMKSLYDENTNQGIRLEGEITRWSTDSEALEDIIKKKESEICGSCHELKKICSQFNFVDELNSVIDTMKANARTLTSMEARDKAEDMIRNISHLADKLSRM